MSTPGNTDGFPKVSAGVKKNIAEHAQSIETEQDTADSRLRESDSSTVRDGYTEAKSPSGAVALDTRQGEGKVSMGQKLEDEVLDRSTEGRMPQFGEPVLVERLQNISLSSQSQTPSVAGAVISGLAQVRETSPTPPAPPPKEAAYLDPTPKTPRASPSPTRTNSRATRYAEDPNNLISFDDDQSKATSGASSDAEFNEIQSRTQLKGADTESRSEIQSIMDQFDEGGGGPGMEEVMSPRLELAGPLLGSPIQHPPRNSSLEPLKKGAWDTSQNVAGAPDIQSPASDAASPLQLGASSSVPPKPPSIRRISLTHPYNTQFTGNDTPTSSNATLSLHKPPPPEPDPEPELPFDFHRFLEQLRHRTADPVAKFLRSFLLEFGKKQWMVHEQVKIIGDFLAFITNKMAQCEVWRGVSDAEFDNAREGMEKLVMNRLYAQTFSPAIPPPASSPAGKGKRKNANKSAGPGRRGQHQEDIERDEILAQKVRIYGWVREKHLDIAPVGESGRRFLVLAQQELLKIKTYRAPRDKVICVLNCCKVIFGLLRNSKSADTSADAFVPLLIYVVLQANPEHLVSNVQYILRFRNQDKLGGEAGYYLSSLMGAIQFIENLDRTTLTVSDEEFEKNVEASVSAITEGHEKDLPLPPNHTLIHEKSTLSRPEVTQDNSMEAEYSVSRRPTTSRDGIQSSAASEGMEDNAAVAGLLRTIQRPLSTIGRIFSEDGTSQQRPGSPAGSNTAHVPIPQPGIARRLSPAVFQPPSKSGDRPRSPERTREGEAAQNNHRLNAEEAAARQASAETAEAQRIQRIEHANVVETLAGMFPDLDKDLIDDVVRVKEGRGRGVPGVEFLMHDKGVLSTIFSGTIIFATVALMSLRRKM